MPVSYIICAAGRGSRTSAISATRPKPFLKLKGKSLLQRSIESLPLQNKDQLLILHSAIMTADELTAELAPFRKICEVQTQLVAQLTRGQLETAILGLPEIPAGNSVCIFNSDTAFTCDGLLKAIDSLEWDGLIPCSQQSGDAWSFCDVIDPENTTPRVVKVAEKQRISKWCSVGFYWFRSKALLQDSAIQELAELPSKQEVYVAPVYNRMIAAGYKIGMNKVETFSPMGSVEQIEKYWGLSLSQMRTENEI
jgi:NDP-sugar pyrophosphorylase family protein